MTDFKRGDHIRVTSSHSENVKDMYLHETEDGTLVTYHPFDPFCPVVPFHDLLAERDRLLGTDSEEILSFDIIESAEDVLPTVPGQYEDVIRYLLYMNGVGDTEFQSNPWTLNADGVWTAPDGSTRPADDSWILAAEGFRFVPWDERDSIPEKYSLYDFGL